MESNRFYCLRTRYVKRIRQCGHDGKFAAYTEEIWLGQSCLTAEGLVKKSRRCWHEDRDGDYHRDMSFGAKKLFLKAIHRHFAEREQEFQMYKVDKTVEDTGLRYSDYPSHCQLFATKPVSRWLKHDVAKEAYLDLTL